MFVACEGDGDADGATGAEDPEPPDDGTDDPAVVVLGETGVRVLVAWEGVLVPRDPIATQLARAALVFGPTLP